ncbi:hypothetical protein GCM10010521_01250 [Streptomyces rameus]|uniref:Insertion element IS402-like domain-containing protein n=1 Tax=Streptomyces rameus TaxID=68261 RepID=A0ABP6MK95_9ACTN
MGIRIDLTDAQWERPEPLLPVSNGRCGRWRDHRQVVNGVLYRIRTGVQWRDLPERFGQWKTVHERHLKGGFDRTESDRSRQGRFETSTSSVTATAC